MLADTSCFCFAVPARSKPKGILQKVFKTCNAEGFVLHRNISDADFGLYQLIVVKDNKHRENQTLTIAANSVPALTSQAIVTGISIAVVFALLIFIIVVMRSNVYIRVYYKRIFGVYVIGELVQFFYNALPKTQIIVFNLFSASLI